MSESVSLVVQEAVMAKAKYRAEQIIPMLQEGVVGTGSVSEASDS
jgi:hypothetical protein